MNLLSFFFLLMLLLPTMYQPIRGLMLIVLCCGALSKKNHKVDSIICLFLIVNVIVCFINISYSVIVGNPGATAFTSIMIFWPLLYLFFMIKCTGLFVFYKLYKIIIYGGLGVLGMNALFLFNNSILKIGFIESLGTLLGFKYGLYDGFMEYFAPSQSYLPYFLYFSISLLLIPHEKMKINEKCLILTALLSAILILVSGRRAMWLTMGILPIYLIVALSVFKHKKTLLIKICILCFIIGAIISYVLVKFFDLDYMYTELMSSFDFVSNDSNIERVLQGRTILADFWRSPLFGNGIGYVSSYIRTPNRPWEYELVYHYLLSSFGVVGMAFLSIPFIWVIYQSIKIVRLNKSFSDLIIPSISGLIVFLIINASNPYLLKFDFLWIFFLPILVINQIRVESERH